MLVGMLVIGLIDNFIARMATHVGLWQFLFMRMCLSLPVLVLASRAGAGVLSALSWPKVIARSVLVAIAMMLYFAALAFVTIGEALAGLFTSPIFILLISVIFLRHRIGVWRVLAVGLGFCGVLMVLQPGGAGFSWLSLMPVLGGLFYALGNLATRHWCSRESTLVMLAGIFTMQGLIGGAVMLVLALAAPNVPAGADGFVLRGWTWPLNAAVWPILAMQVFGALFGIFCAIRAYQWGEASQVSVFEYSIMIFGPAFGFLLFGQTLGWAQLAGIGLIFAAGGIIALRSRVEAASVTS
jgi:drug/metabolite transporter (DMT)-like permease